MEGHYRRHFSIICPLGGHSRGHTIMFCLLQGRPSTFAAFLQTSGHQEGQSPHVPLRSPVQPLNNLTLFAAWLFSESWPTVRLGQWLETTRLQLLQGEGKQHEELVRGQTWLCAGGGRPGVHYFRRRRAVRHRKPGLVTSWPLDWVFHTGERNTVRDEQSHFTVWYCIWNVLKRDFSVIFIYYFLFYFFKKCNKISCEVEAGNTQFTWSDAEAIRFTNWSAGEPTV